MPNLIKDIKNTMIKKKEYLRRYSRNLIFLK
jgi:hypothetical protein